MVSNKEAESGGLRLGSHDSGFRRKLFAAVAFGGGGRRCWSCSGLFLKGTECGVNERDRLIDYDLSRGDMFYFLNSYCLFWLEVAPRISSSPIYHGVHWG